VNKIEQKNTPAALSISASTDPAAGGIGGEPKMHNRETMNIRFFTHHPRALCASAALLISVAAVCAAVPTPGAAPIAQQDEQAIRATADAFVKAFNAADVKAMGALWAPDATYTDEAGQAYRGRPAIQKLYAALFKEHPGATMTVTIESLRFMGPEVAIERGIAKLASPSTVAGTGARYSVVHAKRKGKWTMLTVRDAPYVTGSNQEHLQDLAWLIGSWTSGESNAAMHISFEWMANTNFIKCTYTVAQDGQAPVAGMQIIGWNPSAGRIVSWLFDAQGGVANDVWIKSGATWIIDANGQLPDGDACSAVNVLTRLDADSFSWQSVKRTLDGVRLPNTPLVKLVRLQSDN